ncbi:rRNA biogenesis protein rrp36 [Penicillium brasilianum]|uniref:rRNA biogenesis protein RRP36 n=1 Tax=Penicillium brasilianum TaxID=104259 RepID=A0A1S9RPN8_PENBI|nr:rRNA biogenesis protein rrp36 [Penicillium brasilianum]
MAIKDMLNRRVRARPDGEDDVYSEQSDMGEEPSQDEAEEEEDSDAEDAQSGDSQDEGSENDGSDSDEDSNDNASAFSEEEDSDPNDDIQASLSNISFGALAKAQASMGPKKSKSKATKSTPETTSTASPLDDIRAQIRAARDQKREAAAALAKDSSSKEKKAARASKHAPMVQSSKYAVGRKRVIVEPPATAKARDPRFDAAVMGHSGKGLNAKASEKNYAFLEDYRASELRDLKRQMAQTKNPEAKEALKRQIRSATDQQKARENRKREEAVIAEHKKKEKEAIRDGKKSTPYYLKKSDLKKQVMQKKYEEMGSRDRAKALERRRKKIASKERKDMPMERRGWEGMGGGDEPPARGGGGGGKRRRLE